MNNRIEKINSLARLLDEAFKEEIEYLNHLTRDFANQEDAPTNLHEFVTATERLNAHQQILKDVIYYSRPVA